MYVKVGFTTSVGLKLGAALKAIPLICVVVLGALRRIFFFKKSKTKLELGGWFQVSFG